MATALARLFTVMKATPELLADADQAGPSINEFMALLVHAAELLKDPAMAKFAKRAQQLIKDLDLGGAVPVVRTEVTKAVQQVAAGWFTADEMRQFDRAGRPDSGGVG